MAYKPNIGETGFYTLKAPFDVLLTPKTLYTCQSIDTINKFIASGESVYDKFYGPLKVSNDQYQQDVADNVTIIGLQAGTGEWVFVPSSFIVTAPVSNGVKYIPVVIGLSLGAIPDAHNLESVIQQCKDVITSSLGIDPEVKGVVVGSPKWFTQEEHDLIMQVRQEKVSTATPSNILVNVLKKENEQLKGVIAEYEKVFKMVVPKITSP